MDAVIKKGDGSPFLFLFFFCFGRTGWEKYAEYAEKHVKNRLETKQDQIGKVNSRLIGKVFDGFTGYCLF